MSDYGWRDEASQMDRSRLQLRIMAQLLEAAATMHSIDELFQWLATMITQRFQVQVVEFWTTQNDLTGQSTIQLRTFASQDPSVPRHIVTNSSIAEVAGTLLREQRSYTLQPVSRFLSSHHTTLFGRYGLYHFASYFSSSKALLPPAGSATTNVPTPLAMTTLLFLRQPLPQDSLPTIGLVLEQAVQIAEKRGLLLPKGSSPGLLSTPTPPLSLSTPQISSEAESLPPLTELIPRPRKNSELLVSSNPLSGSVDIPDKQARRLYAAIDGRKNVRELCTATKMNIEEASSALQKLLSLHRIDLYKPNGQLVKGPRPSQDTK